MKSGLKTANWSEKVGHIDKKKVHPSRVFAFVPKGLLATLIASFVLHLFLAPLEISLRSNGKARSRSPSTIRVVLGPKKANSDRRPKSKQVVDSELVPKQKSKRPAKFYGEKNQHFSRQTVAKRIGAFKTAGQGHAKGSTTVARSPSPKTPSRQDSRPRKKTAKNLKKIKLSDLAMNRASTQHKAVSKSPLGHARGARGRMGLSRRSDFVEDIPLGEMTRLNTVEYKYYGFYRRIKQKLEQYWGHSLHQKAEKLWKSGRRFPASENRITNLTVTIDHKGTIVDITIRSTSGVRELDEAAVESFNRAGPFPNPPKGMVKNGFAQIEWGFVIRS